MRASLLVSSFGCWLVAALLASTASAAEMQLKTVDLTGDYEDSGSVVSATSDEMAQEPFLSALVRLEFDSKLAAIYHDQTARIRIKHVPGSLEIQIIDRDGEVSWRGQWGERTGYVQRGSSVVLRFRRESPANEEVLFTFEPVASRQLLQVTVQRIETTILGPMVRQKGEYLFPRMP